MNNRSRIKLGTTVYSLTNEFHSREYNFEQLVRKIADEDLGPGLEVVGFQSIRTFPHVDDDYVRWFRGLVDECGLEPSCLGLNADINVRRGQPMSLDAAVETQRVQLETAAKLGFKIARVQGYILGPDAYEKLLPDAERLDVKMGIEIHAPHTVHDPDIIAYREAFDRIDSPYLGFIPDFSTSAVAVPPSYIAAARNAGATDAAIEEALTMWRDGLKVDRMTVFQRWMASGIPMGGVGLLARMFGMFGRQSVEAWREIMPRVIHVHGKFYDIDANGEETAIPFRELLPMLVDAGYEGYISSEWEGHVFTDDSGFDNLRKQQKLSVDILDAAVREPA